MKKRSNGANLSRRGVLKAGALAGVAAITGGGLTAQVASASEARRLGKSGKSKTKDLILVNGRIHTMDGENRVASSVVIRNGRFLQVGHHPGHHGGDARVIDLRGKTVVPGLIESHTHFVSLANRPGYHVADLELATSIAEVQEMLAARREGMPADAFVTAMGGWHPRQWAEGRLPTLTELDAAVSDRPVFLFQGFNGPCRVNSLGKTFFENVTSPLAGPVAVAADGSIAAGLASTTALYHLRVRQTFEDKKRSALDAMAFSARVGVTALLDQTLVAVASGPLDPQPGHPLATLDHYRMYDAWIQLHREGSAFVRLQINFLHNQSDPNLPELKERLKNQFPFFGDDMLRTGGIGEWAAPIGAGAVWVEAQRLVAQARWRNENAASSLAALQQIVEAYEAVDAEFGIKDLRWGVQHVNFATPELLQRLKNLHCGVSMSGLRWQNTLPASGQPVGSPFRMILDSGIKAGLHEDGVHIAPHNPWFALHYATTGLNFAGAQVNGDQQITRQEALNCYTNGNAWYLNRENDLGAIEEGRLGDLVVLDRDYFRASDADMRKTRPVLTVVGGEVVHDSDVL
jgi:hypothetical protein